MPVIADASPLHYLILLESTDILPVLFGRIVIPRAMAAELQHPQTPAVVRVWMASPPAWLDIQNVGTPSDASLSHLDPGEQEAIMLAQALRADLLLMDEWEGRREAERRCVDGQRRFRSLGTGSAARVVGFTLYIDALTGDKFLCPYQPYR